MVGAIALIAMVLLLNRPGPTSENVEAGGDDPEQVQVFVTVKGEEMEIIYRHESGEKRTIPVEYGEWNYDYYGEVGDPIYIVARDRLATGTVHLTVRVQGEDRSEQCQDHSDDPYGEVIMEKTIPSLR